MSLTAWASDEYTYASWLRSEFSVARDESTDPSDFTFEMHAILDAELIRFFRFGGAPHILERHMRKLRKVLEDTILSQPSSSKKTGDDAALAMEEYVKRLFVLREVIDLAHKAAEIGDRFTKNAHLWNHDLGEILKQHNMELARYFASGKAKSKKRPVATPLSRRW